MYVTRQKIPYIKLSTSINNFFLISFSKNITHKALQGPTKDFEDNVQLHSAVAADCDYFLTSDKNLLKTKFFGKTQILSSL